MARTRGEATLELVAEHTLPVTRVTSCALGGDDLADLHVTTAREGASDADLAREPLAGGLFRCRPGVRGLPSTPVGG